MLRKYIQSSAFYDWKLDRPKIDESGLQTRGMSNAESHAVRADYNLDPTPVAATTDRALADIGSSRPLPTLREARMFLSRCDQNFSLESTHHLLRCRLAIIYSLCLCVFATSQFALEAVY